MAKESYTSDLMTRHGVKRVFQLSPEPPAMAALNDYILAAKREKKPEFFLYFLHHYERSLNSYICRFLQSDGSNQYNAERFLDLKLSCAELLLQKLRTYKPNQGAAFTTYVYPFLMDQMLRFRMQEEAWSFDSLDAYKKIRQAAWMLGNSGDAAKEFAEKNDCDLETAEEYIKAARSIRNRGSFYITEQDEDNEETGEDVTRDDRWDYTEILWNGIRAEAVQKAFDKLDFREQTLLEKRNAICMTCGRVSPWKGRPTFEKLAVMFEGTTAKGAERAYHRAVEHLTEILVEDGILRCIRMKLESQKRRKKKNAAAVYLYQADNDGEWGEIHFDFESGKAKFIRLADWDTVRTNIYAKMAIRYVMKCKDEDLPKEVLLGFER
jgi:hypothetical protein